MKAFGSGYFVQYRSKNIILSSWIPPAVCFPLTFNTSLYTSPFPEHEWCHGRVAQAADGAGCERQVHRGASLRVHPRMHCVWSAGHPSLPRMACWPPGELGLIRHCCLSVCTALIPNWFSCLIVCRRHVSSNSLWTLDYSARLKSGLLQKPSDITGTPNFSRHHLEKLHVRMFQSRSRDFTWTSVRSSQRQCSRCLTNEAMFE